MVKYHLDAWNCVHVCVCFWLIVLCIFPWNNSSIRKSTCCPIIRANFRRIKNRKWKRINHKILWANFFFAFSESLIEWCEYKRGSSQELLKWREEKKIQKNLSISSVSRFIHALQFNYIHPNFIGSNQWCWYTSISQWKPDRRWWDRVSVSVSIALHIAYGSHLNFILKTL